MAFGFIDRGVRTCWKAEEISCERAVVPGFQSGVLTWGFASSVRSLEIREAVSDRLS